MGVTRLKRKARRNKQTAAKRQDSIKHLTSTPVLKKIDKEEAKVAFGAPVKETKEKVGEAEPQVEEATAEVVEAATEETTNTEEVETPEASVEETVNEEVESAEEEASTDGEKEE